MEQHCLFHTMLHAEEQQENNTDMDSWCCLVKRKGCLLSAAAAAAAARSVLGSRPCSVLWGGSVLDSVVGAFLTQAVSDVQSSTAFMNLAATWPAQKQRHLPPAAAAAGANAAAAAGGAATAGCAPVWYQRGAVGERPLATVV
jgi:hypothetical protein